MKSRVEAAKKDGALLENFHGRAERIHEGS